MNFLKKHYEKILLGVVLLGLVGAAVFLPFFILHDRIALDNQRFSIIHHPVKPLKPLDMAIENHAIARVHSSYHLDFERTNRLFNPVEWERAVDGSLLKIEGNNVVGPRAVVVTKIAPLYFILSLDSVETNYGMRYVIGVERQAARVPWRRAKQQRYASVGDKNDVFTITDVKGPPANPTQLVLQLTDSGETVTISTNKPFRRVDGYTANLKYSPEGRNWQDQRVGDPLKFAGGDYIIVAIDRNEVVLLARSNQKKTTLVYKPK